MARTSIQGVVVCVDCGGKAPLVTHITDDEELEPGTILTYRCNDCFERLDIVHEPDDDRDDTDG
jgi:predicted nucleic acid-binding Zn ribbon protein